MLQVTNPTAFGIHFCCIWRRGLGNPICLLCLIWYGLQQACLVSVSPLGISDEQHLKMEPYQAAA